MRSFKLFLEEFPLEKEKEMEVGSKKKKSTNKNIDLEPSLDKQDKENNLGEALDVTARLKRGNAMRRKKTKLTTRRNISMKRAAPLSVLMKRARRATISSMKRRFAGGRDYNTLSAGEKVRVDKRMESKSIKRMVAQRTAKFLPQVRQLQKLRLQQKTRK